MDNLFSVENDGSCYYEAYCECVGVEWYDSWGNNMTGDLPITGANGQPLCYCLDIVDGIDINGNICVHGKVQIYLRKR